MLKSTNQKVFIMMYEIDGFVSWWGVYDSEEAACQDGGACYQNCTGIAFNEENEKYSEIIEDALNAKGCFEDTHIYIWIEETILFTKDNISSL